MHYQNIICIVAQAGMTHQVRPKSSNGIRYARKAIIKTLRRRLPANKKTTTSLSTLIIRAGASYRWHWPVVFGDARPEHPDHGYR